MIKQFSCADNTQSTYFNYFITEDVVGGGAKKHNRILYNIFRGR